MRLRQPSRPREIVASSKSASFLRRAPAGLSPLWGLSHGPAFLAFGKALPGVPCSCGFASPAIRGSAGWKLDPQIHLRPATSPCRAVVHPAGAFSCLCPDHKNLRIFDFLKGRFPGVLYLCAVMPPAPQIGNLHGGTMHGSDTRSGIFSRLFTGPPRSQDKSEQRWPVSVTALASPGRRLGSTLS